MSLPKVKPKAGAPKLKKKAAAVPKAAYRLLADQYRARQGNLTQTADPEPENGTAATEYGERQIHQTVQGAAHTFSSAAQASFRKAGRSIRQRMHNPAQKTTSRQIGGRFSISSSRFSAKAAKKQAAKPMQKTAAAAAKAAGRKAGKATAKATAKRTARVGRATGRAALAIGKGILMLLSSLPVVAVTLLIVLIAAVAAFFGFGGGSDTAGVAPVLERLDAEMEDGVAELTAALPDGAVYRVEHTGPADYWTEVLAAYAASGYPDEIYGAFSMTDEQIQRLEATFWGMTEISSAAISTEQGTVYAVTVQHLSASEWAAAQGWESDQREYLDTLLADFREELAALVPDAIKQPPAASGSTA